MRYQREWPVEGRGVGVGLKSTSVRFPSQSWYAASAYSTRRSNRFRMLVPFLVLMFSLTLSLPPSHSMTTHLRCISPPCDYTSLDVDGFLGDGISDVIPARYARAVHPRSLAGLLQDLAPVAAATSSLLAGVANLGFAASNPYYNDPWYGGYGGAYAPGYGYGYPYAPFRPFPYFR